MSRELSVLFTHLACGTVEAKVSLLLNDANADAAPLCLTTEDPVHAAVMRVLADNGVRRMSATTMDPTVPMVESYLV